MLRAHQKILGVGSFVRTDSLSSLSMTGPNIPRTQTSLNHEQVEELRSLFKSFDRNHDGTISREELYSVLASMNMPPTNEQLDAMVQANHFVFWHTYRRDQSNQLI